MRFAVQLFSYTMEVSFFSYRRNDDAYAVPVAYTENKCARSVSHVCMYYIIILYSVEDMELGRNLGLAMLHYSEVESGKRMVHFDRPFETFMPAHSVNNLSQTVQTQQNRKPPNHKKNGSIRLKGVASGLSAANAVTKANNS